MRDCRELSPPSTASTCPVTQPCSGIRNYRMPLAASSGSPMRPSGGSEIRRQHLRPILVPGRVRRLHGDLVAGRYSLDRLIHAADLVGREDRWEEQVELLAQNAVASATAFLSSSTSVALSFTTTPITKKSCRHSESKPTAQRRQLSARSGPDATGGTNND
jgi:hypothetical protein